MRKTYETIFHRNNHQLLNSKTSGKIPSALGSLLFMVLSIDPVTSLGATLPNSLTLEWDPSPSADVSNYRVYFGPVSKSYTNQLELGNVTKATISNLPGGPTFFAITATSSDGLESGFSSEISFRPGPPVVLLTRTTEGTPLLTVQTTTGRTQEVHASSNLIDWSVIGTVTLGSSGTAEITDSVGLAHPARFYRTRLP